MGVFFVQLLVFVVLILYAVRKGARRRAEQHENFPLPKNTRHAEQYENFPFPKQGANRPILAGDSPDFPESSDPHREFQPQAAVRSEKSSHRKKGQERSLDRPSAEEGIRVTDSFDSDTHLSAAEESREGIHVDLPMAVIYSEILRPKFKDDEWT